MRTQKILTKKPLALRSFRLPIADVARVREAAAQDGISQSEFVRRALKAEAGRVLSAKSPVEAER